MMASTTAYSTKMEETCRVAVFQGRALLDSRRIIPAGCTPKPIPTVGIALRIYTYKEAESTQDAP